VCDHETSTKRGGPGPYRAVEPYKKKICLNTFIVKVRKGERKGKLITVGHTDERDGKGMRKTGKR
jgi:hypothetical protein